MVVFPAWVGITGRSFIWHPNGRPYWSASCSVSLSQEGLVSQVKEKGLHMKNTKSDLMSEDVESSGSGRCPEYLLSEEKKLVGRDAIPV